MVYHSPVHHSNISIKETHTECQLSHYRETDTRLDLTLLLESFNHLLCPPSILLLFRCQKQPLGLLNLNPLFLLLLITFLLIPFCSLLSISTKLHQQKNSFQTFTTSQMTEKNKLTWQGENRMQKGPHKKHQFGSMSRQSTTRWLEVCD